MEKKLVKVLSQTFEVIEKETIEFGESTIGRINHTSNMIYICSTLPVERKKSYSFTKLSIVFLSN